MFSNFGLQQPNGKVIGFHQLGVSQGQPIFPVSPTDFLDTLPGYDGSEGNIELLDQARLLSISAAYFPILRVFPNASAAALTFQPRETKEQTFTVPSGSLLVSLVGYSESDAGFDFQVYDRGAKTSLVQGKTLGHNTLFAPDIQQNNADPTGPFWLTSPLAILEPGQVTVEITNLLTTGTNLIQLGLHFAMPLTDKNKNVVEIKEV